MTDREITKITIVGESNVQIALRKKAGWFIEKNGVDYRADNKRIEKMLNILRDLTQKTIVSTNPKKHAEEYGIKTSKITVETKNKSFTLYVGYPALDNDHFARFEKQNIVFIGKNLGSLYLNSDYRDLNIPFLNNPLSVQGIDVLYQETTKLIKKNDEWFDQDQNRIPIKAVEDYLNRISMIDAIDILINKPDSDNIPDLTIKLTTQNESKTAEFTPLSDGYYLMQISGASNLYVIKEYFVSNLKKTHTDFLSGPKAQP